MRAHAQLCKVTILLLVIVSLLALAGCGDGGGTGGRRVTLRTRVQLSEDAAAGFRSGLGWSVTLREVLLGSGALYYFDGAPAVARRDGIVSPWRAVERFLSIPIAHAHPGHYLPGNALGQMTEPYTEDLLAGPVQLPDGTGVTGVYRSARFAFAEEVQGPDAARLGEDVAVVVGRAEKDGEAPREFRATATFAEVAKSQAAAEIDGCAFEEADVQGDGVVTVTVHPEPWFQIVDFGELQIGTEDAPAELEPGARPQVAFAQGLAQLSAYRFAYSR